MKTRTQKSRELAINAVKTEKESCYAASKKPKIPEKTLRSERLKFQKNNKEIDEKDQIFNKCRLCLEGFCSDDFRVQITDEIEKDIEMKLLQLFQHELKIEFQLNQSGFNFICESCNSQLENFSCFRKEILQKHKQAEYYHIYVKSEPVDDDIVDIFDNSQEIIASIKEEIFCEPFHMDAVQPEVEPVSEEMREDESRSTKRKMSPSYSSEKTETSSAQKNVRRDRKEKMNMCEFCGKTMYETNLLRHVKAVHLKIKDPEGDKPIKTLKCDECEKFLLNAESLRKHKKYFHSGEQIFPCHYCGKTFNHYGSLFLHVSRSHKRDENSVRCDVCYKTMLKYDLKKHMLIHQTVEGRNFKCDDCGKFYKTAHRLKSHKRNTHIESKFVCNYKDCGKRFKCNFRFKFHMNSVHLKIKNFHCTRPNCSNAYSDKQKLDKHIAIFHDKLRQNCPIDACKFSVGRIDYMRNHLKKHSELSSEELTHYLAVIKNMQLV